MLVFPLKKEWYEKIKSGKKIIEYREVKPYWTKRICSELSKEFERRFGSHYEIDVFFKLYYWNYLRYWGISC